MAAGARTGGAMAIQYEDFQPKSEWKEDDRANILLIYLPAGFQREQMKVSYIHSTRIVRVAGERPLAHNKWSRFNQAFPVPQNCEANKIRASFQNGVLTITMPKATVTAAPKEAKATQEAPIPPPEAPQQIPQKVSPAGEAAEAKKAGKEDTATSGSASQKQTNNGKKMEGIVSPRQEKPAPDTIDRQAKGKSAGEEMGKPTQQVTEEALSEQLETSKKRKESMDMIPAGDDKYGPIKPLMEKEKGKTEEQRMVKKLKEELKNVAAAAKKTVQGLAMDLRSEERQTMVNMGVAVLVIAALGAYFYYRYRSSGTGATAEE